jgi:hypothetical protein
MNEREDTDVNKSLAQFAIEKHVRFTSINVQENILKNPTQRVGLVQSEHHHHNLIKM